MNKKTLKLVSWNVNGLRACAKKGFLDWIGAFKPDILCVQEMKAYPGQLTPELRNIPGYQAYFHPAQKKGYSGVATYTRVETKNIQYGLGIEIYDQEGRVLITEHNGFTLVNVYFPNGQRDLNRVPFKLDFSNKLLNLCESLRKKGCELIICGDYNVAHKPIDLKNPKSNENNSGFTLPEREWMDHFLSHGYIDTFRRFNDEPGRYTWWSYRPGVREKNIGWRIDYHCVTPGLLSHVKKSLILQEVMGSDHCPVVLELQK
ncbi:MAG: exodeoxyribonuclease III [Deltaproteobacteria bacterium]|nr:exodeoxyribonuclease III [Deltaproteobacteria bacterium]